MEEDIVNGSKCMVLSVLADNPPIKIADAFDTSFASSSNTTNENVGLYQENESLSGNDEIKDVQLKQSSLTDAISFSLMNWSGLSQQIFHENFSNSLKTALEHESELTWKLKHTLLEEICFKMKELTLYPTSEMYNDIAKELVTRYPYLKESIGSGYGGWKQSLKNKFKNMRRNEPTEQVLKRKRSNTGKKIPIKVHVTKTQHTKDNDELSKTFEERRENILNKKVFSSRELKEKYPTLFTKTNIEKEWSGITNHPLLYDPVKHFLGLNKEKIVFLVTKRRS